MAEYSTKEFFGDVQTVGKETLVVAEWLLVVVAFSWASEKIQSAALYYFAFALYLFLGLHIAVIVNRALWWAFPTVGPNKLSDWRTAAAAVVALVFGFGGLSVVDASINALLCAESAGTYQVDCAQGRATAERTLYPSWLRK